MRDVRFQDGLCWCRVSHQNGAKESFPSYYQIQDNLHPGIYWAKLCVRKMAKFSGDKQSVMPQNLSL